MHHPVLLQEVLENLNVKRGGLYIDATTGEGGYSLAILERGGKVLAIDWDEKQIQNLEFRIKNGNAVFVCENFANIESIAKKHHFYPADGIVFDLGLSMAQINESGRGFSFNKKSEPLDMRLSLELKNKASDIINSYSQRQLYEIFAKYSEELNSGSISQAIVRSRTVKKIQKVGGLVDIVRKTLGRDDEKVYRRIFQALRIAVNNEFDNLKKGLAGALHIIKQTGRIVVVTFHSLEDRIVKQFVKQNNLRFMTKKIILGNRALPYERSAKLRVIGISKYYL